MGKLPLVAGISQLRWMEAKSGGIWGPEGFAELSFPSRLLLQQQLTSKGAVASRQLLSCSFPTSAAPGLGNHLQEYSEGLDVSWHLGEG